MPVAGEKSAAYLCKLKKAKLFKEILKRQILAERHKVNFIVYL